MVNLCSVRPDVEHSRERSTSELQIKALQRTTCRRPGLTQPPAHQSRGFSANKLTKSRTHPCLPTGLGPCTKHTCPAGRHSSQPQPQPHTRSWEPKPPEQSELVLRSQTPPKKQERNRGVQQTTPFSGCPPFPSPHKTLPVEYFLLKLGEGCLIAQEKTTSCETTTQNPGQKRQPLKVEDVPRGSRRLFRTAAGSGPSTHHRLTVSLVLLPPAQSLFISQSQRSSEGTSQFLHRV